MKIQFNQVIIDDGEILRDTVEYLSNFRNMPIAFWTNNGGGLCSWEAFVYISNCTREEVEASLLDSDWAKVDNRMPENYDKAIKLLLDNIEDENGKFAYSYYKVLF